MRIATMAAVAVLAVMHACRVSDGQKPWGTTAMSNDPMREALANVLAPFISNDMSGVKAGKAADAIIAYLDEDVRPSEIIIREQRSQWDERVDRADPQDRDVVQSKFSPGDPMREALEKIRRIPSMPFPDPGAHSWITWGQAVYRAYAEIQRTATAALALPVPQDRDADKACQELCGHHGFATGHGDTVADMIREIDAQITEGRMRRALEKIKCYLYAAAPTEPWIAECRAIATAALPAPPAGEKEGR